MKRIFPNTIVQFILCTTIAIVAVTPILVINLYYNIIREDVFIHLIFLIVTLLCVVIFYIINNRNNTNPRLILIPKQKKFTHLKYAVLLILGIHFIYVSLNNFNKKDIEIREFDIMLFFGAIILAPIMEELIFRQYFFSGLLQRYKPIIAIIINSVVFGLIHINPTQIVIGIITGFLFCSIFYKEKTIGSTIILHFIANFFATTLPYILDSTNKCNSIKKT